MLYSFHKLKFLVFIPSLLAGCAQNAVVSKTQQKIGPCEKLSIVQGGKEVQENNGIFLLAREPFVIRYVGRESDPALSASPDDQLVTTLQQRGRKYLWASAGDYTAYVPNDLPLNSDFRLYTDEKSRKEFASMIGDSYPTLLNSLISRNPENDTATFIPKAGGGFEQEKSGGSYSFEVQRIHGRPIRQTHFSKLYVAYFGTIERFGPPPKGFYRSQNLIKVSWGACVFAFVG